MLQIIGLSISLVSINLYFFLLTLKNYNVINHDHKITYLIYDKSQLFYNVFDITTIMKNTIRFYPYSKS